ncbi:flippase [Pseudomonas sp. GL-RE-19]|uniref:flippase n=1 Tax=Pseudomonas sp. GL-RE-19 TaxID=2832389 RepID=UPI001CBF7EE3|nr:flippase [Pseudomonas sp. GL-RE-19]
MNKYASNTIWFVLEPLLRMVSGVFVGMYAAKYLGAEIYGQLSLIIAFCTLGLASGRLGLDGIMVRELFRAEKSKTSVSAVLANCFWMMNVAGAVSYIAVMAAAYYFIPGHSVIGAAIYGLVLLCQAYNVVELYQQYDTNVKPTTIIRISCLAASTVATYIAVKLEASSLLFFAIPAAEKIVQALLYSIYFRLSGTESFLSRPQATNCKALFKSGLPLLITAFSQTLYTRIDQVIIGSTLPARELGQYAVAAKFYEAWSMLPYLVALSLTAMLIRLHQESVEKYAGSLEQLMRLMFWFNMVVAIVGVYALVDIFAVVMGDGYSGAALPLQIMLFASPFLSLGTVGIRHLIINGLEKKIAKRAIWSVVVNVVLNLTLIPIYGVCGGAIALLITSIFANLVFDFVDKDTRSLGVMKLKSMLPVNI